MSLLFDLALAAAPAVFPLPVVYRWSVWSVAVILLILICLDLFEAWISLLPKLTISIFAGLLFAYLTLPISRTQWREERAASLTGYMTASSRLSMVGKTPLLQLGEGGSILTLGYHGVGPQIKMLYDAGLRIDMGKSGPEITTPVRDRQGRLIAEITRNHWRVAPPPLCWDKNYTSNSLEIRDEGGHVVFQAILFPNRVVLQGEWRDEFGDGLRISDDAITIWKTPQAEKRLEKEIAPIFKYPSSEHWGEYVDGFKPQ